MGFHAELVSWALASVTSAFPGPRELSRATQLRPLSRLKATSAEFGRLLKEADPIIICSEH